MTARRPRLPVAALVLAALLAIVAAQAVAGPRAVHGYETVIGVAAVGSIAVAALFAPAAWVVSGALVLALFQSHWALLHVSTSVDRYAMLFAIATILVREGRHRDGRLQTRPIDWLLILVGLYGVMSLYLGGDFGDRDARFELLDRFGLIPFMLFFVARFAFRTERDRNVLLVVMLGIGTYLGVTAVLETVHAKALVLPHYINDVSQGIHPDRARGPFLDAGANGMVMYIAAVAGVIGFIRFQGRRARGYALFVTALCLLGVLLSLTRAVWIAAVLASVIGLAASRETRRFVVPALVGGALMVTVALAVIPGLAHRVNKRKNDNTDTVWARKNSNAAAVRMVADRPLFGVGWGRYVDESPPYYRQAQDYPLSFLKNLHNVFLENAVELGLIGTLLWVAALLAAVAGGVMRRGPPELRPWKIGLLAVSIAQMTAWATVPAEYIMPTLLFWLWPGITWGPDHESPA